MNMGKSWAVPYSVRKSIEQRNLMKGKLVKTNELSQKVERVMEMHNKSFRFRLGALLACDGRLGYWFTNKRS